VIDIRIFQSQAIEIKKRLSTVQKGLLAKLETIQISFQLIDQMLENLSLKEREAGVAQVVFNEAIIATTRRETSSSSSFPIAEQTRGNILLKEWERNISEGKQQAMKLRKSCEEIFGLLSEIWLGSNGERGMEILGRINTSKYMLIIKENE
jgi:hypothetical protein